MRTTTSYQNDFTNYTNNTSTANAALGLKLVNDSLRHLVGVLFMNEASYTVPGGTVASQAAYQLPFNAKQVINTTVLIGAVLWQPTEIESRKQYDALNVITFTNNFPQFYYIYNDQLLLWPTPAENGDTITINYKKRIKDLSAADYTTGTVSINQTNNTLQGAATNWTTNMAGRWVNIPQTTSNATSGDDEWYQIQTVTSSTALNLYNQYQGSNLAGSNYIIGEVPILPEDYQDLPLYRALYIYYSTISKDKGLAEMNLALYEEGYKALEAEFGAKTSGVGLTPTNASVVNPNFFQNNISQV